MTYTEYYSSMYELCKNYAEALKVTRPEDVIADAYENAADGFFRKSEVGDSRMIGEVLLLRHLEFSMTVGIEMIIAQKMKGDRK